MITITAVCREEGYSDILIYTVKVEDPDNYAEVQSAIQMERNRDIDGDTNEMEVLFTFLGDLYPRSDFR